LRAPKKAALGDQKNRMKISAARLKQIIKEELFYREFHRESLGLEEAEKATDDLPPQVFAKAAKIRQEKGNEDMSVAQSIAIAVSMLEKK